MSLIKITSHVDFGVAAILSAFSDVQRHGQWGGERGGGGWEVEEGVDGNGAGEGIPEAEGGELRISGQGEVAVVKAHNGHVDAFRAQEPQQAECNFIVLADHGAAIEPVAFQKTPQQPIVSVQQTLALRLGIPEAAFKLNAGFCGTTDAALIPTNAPGVVAF